MMKRKINKILIPNRGEIAVRIQQACRELNIPTVAVFSESDRNALHVRYADQAYPLPGVTPAHTYLNQKIIFKIARTAGADAIHPGYGFLSENADFARNCEKENIIFIGPSAESIELMGFKTKARNLMQKVKIPVIPGSAPLKDLTDALKEAERIKYPVLIKAAAGGGGKGMRVARSPEELRPAFAACRREAESAFGNPTVYLEKYFLNSRHIEFQIMADLYGNIINLFDRECSIQRRHQKIIEEAPSAALTADLREKMGQTAIEVARACNYTNAGTVEFLLDDKKNFYFLEMNTRIQVEHPVTEMVTGIDLVKQQIRIAGGESINPDLTPSLRGAAIECRIYAEDPDNNFLPSPGKIKYLSVPQGPGIRNDSGVYNGYTIPLEYDPMIAKLVVHAQNRKDALARMIQALKEYRILGIKSNVSYLSKIIRHPQFISGDYNTQFLKRFGEDLKGAEAGRDETFALVAAGILKFMQESAKQSTIRSKTRADKSAWKFSGRIYKNGSIF